MTDESKTPRSIKFIFAITVFRLLAAAALLILIPTFSDYQPSSGFLAGLRAAFAEKISDQSGVYRASYASGYIFSQTFLTLIPFFALFSKNKVSFWIVRICFILAAVGDLGGGAVVKFILDAVCAVLTFRKSAKRYFGQPVKSDADSSTVSAT